jgi:hypothetical protein
MLSSKHLLLISLGLGCATLLCPSLAATPPQDAQTEIPTVKLVGALRLLNTQEYAYQHEKGRFATLEEMFNFLRTKGILSKAPIDLENPKPYELTITTSPDGMHYQIALK